MKYSITKIVMDSPGFIEIDEAEYIRIENAMKNLFEALFLEEKLDFVTENYNEFESELLLIASRSIIFNNFSYFSANQDRNLICRRIINLMSACRMYLDQSVHHIHNFNNLGFDPQKIEQAKNFEYENVLGYRVIEALRNYTQHRGYPIQSLKFSHEYKENKIDNSLCTSIVPLINVAELAQDGKFKRSVLKELESIQKNDLVDIRPFIRQYIECIGKIHEKIRELLKNKIILWEETIEEAIKKFQEIFGEEISTTALAIVKETDEGEFIESKIISKGFLERRHELEIKNSLFINLHGRYASNEIG